MKTLSIVKTVLPALGVIAIAAAPAAAEEMSEEITFAYTIDAAMLDSEADASAVYADLLREARAACTPHGVRGLTTTDEACVADLVGKVIEELSAPTLDVLYDGSIYAAEAQAPVSVELASR